MSAKSRATATATDNGSLQYVMSRKESLAMVIAQLELTLDALPRDSRYSSQLVEASKQEEMDPTNAEISQRVDKLMEKEIRQFHAANVVQNLKRWEQLKSRLEKDRSKDKEHSSSLESVTEVPLLSTGVSKLDLELEELRLDAYYNSNWGKIEAFNLTEAFNSQRAKIDVEWDKHESELQVQYFAKRSQITGSVESIAPISLSKSSPDRWQHPEKQKSLIHTAPVLSPKSSDKATTISAGSGLKAALSINKEQTAALEALERNYKRSVFLSQQQKDSALRWVFRQSIRLHSQAAEIQRERQVIGGLLEDEYRFLRRLTNGI